MTKDPADSPSEDPVPEYTDAEPPRRRALVPPLPVWLVVAAVAIAAGLILGSDRLDRTQANILVLILTFVALMSLFAWFTLFSGFPKLLRWSFAGGVVVAVVAFFVFFRVAGTTGQLVPQFTYRFAPKPDERLKVPEVADADAAGVDLKTTTPVDFPRFLGPQATCALDGPELDLDWSQRPPRMLWKRRIGGGWSAFSAVNGFAITMEQRGPLELVTCFRIRTGEPCWTASTEARFDTIQAGVGPRATPTIHDGMVYTLGALGNLQCLDGADGQVVWQRSVPEDCGVSIAEDRTSVSYGRSNSPLIVNDLLIVSGGGPRAGRKYSLLAYDRHNGNPAWKGGDRQAAYCTPTLASLAETPQILIVNEDNVSSHDPATGEVLWEYDWPGSSSGFANVSQAVPVGNDRVFLSNGYGSGAMLLQITYSGGDGWRATELWHRPTAMRTKFTNVVIHDQSVYGLSDGILECLDLETGGRRWKRRAGRYGHGQILRVGGALLVQAEPGYVALIELSPDDLLERGRIAALNAKTWNNLCLFGNLLLVRNGVEAACFELPVAEPAAPDSQAL